MRKLSGAQRDNGQKQIPIAFNSGNSGPID